MHGQLCEETKCAIFERAVEILREWAPRKEAGRLLVAAEWQRLLELNA
jgi:hypothetical protein